ncbi:hypothetical protein C4571_00355 [Candidatus Parcubacteria bacterium]|nr:MAG: hypothetical protein C4571_00355 [Candidatus Parcubacteria bacterium]
MQSRNFFLAKISSRKGQSLMEILIATSIGVVMIAAVATLIGGTLRISSQAQKSQVGAALSRGLLDAVRVWTERDWYNVASLATTSLNHYYLATSTSPFSVMAGDEVFIVASTTYTRYFYVDDVGRDASGKILASGGANDPSTKKITVVCNWPQGAASRITAYVTRWGNNVLHQTDWSGGPGQEGPASTTNSRFSTSSEINDSTTTGSIYVVIPGL